MVSGMVLLQIIKKVAMSIDSSNRAQFLSSEQSLLPVQVLYIKGYLYCVASGLLQAIKKVAIRRGNSNHAQSLSSEQAGSCTVSCAGYVRYLFK